MTNFTLTEDGRKELYFILNSPEHGLSNSEDRGLWATEVEYMACQALAGNSLISTNVTVAPSIVAGTLPKTYRIHRSWFNEEAEKEG